MTPPLEASRQTRHDGQPCAAIGRFADCRFFVRSRRRFSVPTWVCGDVARSRGQDWSERREATAEGAREAVLTAVSTTSASVQVGKRASGWSRRSRTAWCPALRRQTRRLEVVRRSLPRNVPSLLTRRVGGLPCLHLLQHGRQLLVVDDRAGLNRLDLIEDLETERRSVELNRKPPVRIVHYLDLLAHQATGQRRRVEEQHHPVVGQG